ncbi:MAG: MBL fold metallo-hydrolase [Oscillospiraceae bacterium]|nr:MBL fold metallo-hydrolase [Oscillospiraceae bacterium]
MTTLHTLASGSSGNAALVSHNGVHILVDAGISCRRITTALRTLGLVPEDLSAVLITHTHTDHIQGLQTFCKHHDVPICASRRTCAGLEYRIAGIASRLRPLSGDGTAEIGGVTVASFPTSHDAPGSCGFRIGGAGFLTDSGYVTEEAEEVLTGVPLLVLEANHDVETLLSGPYPYYLKERILGRQGHLSNGDAADFARRCAENGTKRILLAHLSRENNTPVMARDAVARALPDGFPLEVAPRDTLGPCLAWEDEPCRK